MVRYFWWKTWENTKQRGERLCTNLGLPCTLWMFLFREWRKYPVIYLRYKPDMARRIMAFWIYVAPALFFFGVWYIGWNILWELNCSRHEWNTQGIRYNLLSASLLGGFILWKFLNNNLLTILLLNRVELELRPSSVLPRLWLNVTIQSWLWTSKPTRDCVTKSLPSNPRDWETRLPVTLPTWWREFKRVQLEVSLSSCKKKKEKERTNTSQMSLLWTCLTLRVSWTLTTKLLTWSSLWVWSCH